MSHPISTPKLPKGLSFDLPDHELASEWAKVNGFHLIIDLSHGVEGEEYEEILAFHTAGRLRFVVWRERDCFVVHPLIGRARRFRSLDAALTVLTPASR